MKNALIIYGGWDGHQPQATASLMATELQSSDFSVELSPTLDVLLDYKSLLKYDLIIPHWTMGELQGDQEKNLTMAIESGIGLGGIHGGMGDAFRGNTSYQFMVGGQFVSHPDNMKDYVVDIVKKDDPIVQGIADFTVHTEQYYMHTDPSNEVLATTTFNAVSAPWVNGTVMPVVWKRKYGQGKVFYSSIGHAVADLAVPEVLEITRRGLIWCSR